MFGVAIRATRNAKPAPGGMQALAFLPLAWPRAVCKVPPASLHATVRFAENLLLSLPLLLYVKCRRVHHDELFDKLSELRAECGTADEIAAVGNCITLTSSRDPDLTAFAG